MYNIHIEITRIIYEYEDTFKIEFDKVLKQLKCHCFIYRCSKCFKPYNNCYCYCVTCRSYLKYCHQIYFDENSTYEDDLPNIISLPF